MEVLLPIKLSDLQEIVINQLGVSSVIVLETS
jgi:hypothetical protein